MWQLSICDTSSPEAGKDWRQEEKETTEDEMVDGLTDPTDMSLGKLWELVMDKEAWRAAVHGIAVRHDWATELNWTELKPLMRVLSLSANNSSILVLLYYTQTVICPAICHRGSHTSTVWKAQVKFLSSGPAPQRLKNFFISSKAIPQTPYRC